MQSARNGQTSFQLTRRGKEEKKIKYAYKIFFVPASIVIYPIKFASDVILIYV